MATLKPTTVPAKRLAETISGSATTFKVNNIKSWQYTAGAYTDLTSADFGTRLWAVFRNSAGTLMEIMEIDPATITAASSPITILYRGLKFDGTDLTEVSANKLTWVKGDTVIELGTHVPQLLAQYVDKVQDQTIGGIKTFSSLPATTAGNPVGVNDLARKAYVDSVVAGIATSISEVVPGTAGETLVAGDSVYLKLSDNRWWKTDADDAATVNNVMLGIAQGAGTAGVAITNGVLKRGVDANQSGLVAGEVQYVSNTAGDISNTPGTVEVTVGVAKSSTELYFDPRFNQQITEDQQDAMAGSSGNPSSSNRYVTEDDVSSAGASGKVVRATGTALPALSAENLTNISVQGSYTADGPLTAGQAVVISTGGNTSIYSPQAADTSTTGAIAAGNDVAKWAAQTFVVPAESNMYVNTVILKTVQSAGAGTLTTTLHCTIRATSAGSPTGADLATANTISTSTGGQQTFTFATPVLLTASTTYAFIIWGDTIGADAVWTFYGNYTSTNSGSTWGSAAGQTQNTTVTYGKTTTAGRVLRSNATASDLASNGFIGFVVGTVAEGATAVVKHAGVATGLSGLTVGSTYYLSNTGGAIATSAGSQSRKVGIAVSTTSLLIKQDNV